MGIGNETDIDAANRAAADLACFVPRSGIPHDPAILNSTARRRRTWRPIN